MEQEEKHIKTKKNFERGRMRKSKPFPQSTAKHKVQQPLVDTTYKQGKDVFRGVWKILWLNMNTNQLIKLEKVLPDGKVLLYLGYQSHGGVRASMHRSQDCYYHKKPGRRTGGIYPCFHTVLLMQGK